MGEVVDAVGAGKKKVHNGKEYDYVFDVDIQDGVPPLKLPYNVTGKHENHLRRFASNNYYIAENPFAAAQRFLHENDLPLSYIDQVVKFIEQNTAGVNLSANTEFADPFTGMINYDPGCILSSSLWLQVNHVIVLRKAARPDPHRVLQIHSQVLLAIRRPHQPQLQLQLLPCPQQRLCQL